MGAAYTGIGLDQSLSGPHRDHSRSTDHPRSRGGPLEEVEVACGSWCVQRHLKQRPQGNIIITIIILCNYYYYVLIQSVVGSGFFFGFFFFLFCLFFLVVLGFFYVVVWDLRVL